jgi:D-serine deaminase-like pyridoxal phosphate-dependent protein
VPAGPGISSAALQRNKARVAVATFDHVETVDSVAVARTLAIEAGRAGRRLPVSIQVNAAADPRKRGLGPEDATALAETILGLAELDLRGLMTIGPMGSTARSRSCFRLLRELRDAVENRLGVELPHLCMGMSDDFPVAVEEGATLLRWGVPSSESEAPAPGGPDRPRGRGFMKKIGFVGAGTWLGRCSRACSRPASSSRTTCGPATP